MYQVNLYFYIRLGVAYKAFGMACDCFAKQVKSSVTNLADVEYDLTG